MGGEEGKLDEGNKTGSKKDRGGDVIYSYVALIPTFMVCPCGILPGYGQRNSSRVLETCLLEYGRGRTAWSVLAGMSQQDDLE